MCSAPTTMLLSDLVPFQGDLKKRTESNVKQLAASILTEGLLMPFAVWTTPDGKNMILDGHGRLAALTELALQDNDVAEQKFPCVKITAASEEDARKALLQITSSYGKITREGAVKFCAKIPEYHAPAIEKYVHKPVKRVKKETQATETIIRVSVPNDKVAAVIELLQQVNYIKVLG